jgi:hypothetical protein
VWSRGRFAQYLPVLTTAERVSTAGGGGVHAEALLGVLEAQWLPVAIAAAHCEAGLAVVPHRRATALASTWVGAPDNVSVAPRCPSQLKPAAKTALAP